MKQAKTFVSRANRNRTTNGSGRHNIYLLCGISVSGFVNNQLKCRIAKHIINHGFNQYRKKMHTRQYKLETRRDLNSCGKLELARHQFIGPLCISVHCICIHIYQKLVRSELF